MAEKYAEALKFIDGRMLELTCQMKLQPGKEQEKRINEEMNFLMYVRGLCERAEPLDITNYEHPVDVKAYEGTDKVLTYKCYPCPHCGNWVVVWIRPGTCGECKLHISYLDTTLIRCSGHPFCGYHTRDDKACINGQVDLNSQLSLF